jgi:hypothetical protein
VRELVALGLVAVEVSGSSSCVGGDFGAEVCLGVVRPFRLTRRHELLSLARHEGDGCPMARLAACPVDGSGSPGRHRVHAGVWVARCRRRWSGSTYPHHRRGMQFWSRVASRTGHWTSCEVISDAVASYAEWSSYRLGDTSERRIPFVYRRLGRWSPSLVRGLLLQRGPGTAEVIMLGSITGGGPAGPRSRRPRAEFGW